MAAFCGDFQNYDIADCKLKPLNIFSFVFGDFDFWFLSIFGAAGRTGPKSLFTGKGNLYQRCSITGWVVNCCGLMLESVPGCWLSLLVGRVSLEGRDSN